MPFTHPSRGDHLTDLETLLWRFRIAAGEAQRIIRGFLAYPDVYESINDDLLFGLSNYALIIVSKFLEIWDESGSLVKTERKILPLRRALTPLIDRIRAWKGLRSMRNSSLAHAYLDEDGEPITPWHFIETGEAPTYHAEIILLLYLVHIAVLCILCVFEDVYLPIDSLAGHGKGGVAPPIGPGIETGPEIKPAMDAIAADIAPRAKKECGITISGAFARRFQETLKPRAG